MPKRKFAEGKMPSTKKSKKAQPYRFRATDRSGRSGKPEKKVVDLGAASFAMDTTGSLTLLNGVAAGTDFTDRIGRKTKLSYVYVRGIVNAQDASSGPTLGRLLLVYDKQPAGALPAITDILTAATSVSQVNLNGRDRFVILADKQYAVGIISNTATQSFAGSPTVHPVKIYRNLGLETIYDGTTNAIADISSGALYLVTIGNQAAAAGATFNGTTRVRFTDA